MDTKQTGPGGDDPMNLTKWLHTVTKALSEMVAVSVRQLIDKQAKHLVMVARPIGGTDEQGKTDADIALAGPMSQAMRVELLEAALSVARTELAREEADAASSAAPAASTNGDGKQHIHISPLIKDPSVGGWMEDDMKRAARSFGRHIATRLQEAGVREDIDYLLILQRRLDQERIVVGKMSDMAPEWQVALLRLAATKIEAQELSE